MYMSVGGGDRQTLLMPNAETTLLQHKKTVRIKIQRTQNSTSQQLGSDAVSVV